MVSLRSIMGREKVVDLYNCYCILFSWVFPELERFKDLILKVCKLELEDTKQLIEDKIYTIYTL